MPTDKNGKEYTEQEALDIIPDNENYCYNYRQQLPWGNAAPFGGMGGGPTLKCNYCPFWEKLDNETGKCYYLNIEDTQEGDLLWDGIKNPSCPKYPS